MDVRGPEYVNIVGDVTEAGGRALDGFRYGWFPANVEFPAGIFYLLSAPFVGYFASKPTAVKVTYAMELRAYSKGELDRLSADLCYEMAQIYKGRRSVFSDAFDANTYVRRFNYTFTVELGE